MKRAKKLLEKPGLAARITNILGASLERAFRFLPDRWNDQIGKITRAALQKAVEAAVFSMKSKPGKKSSDTSHKLAVAVTGGVSGFFGLGALIIELPISTTIMLRSIADVARSEGEHVNTIESKMACLEVFALGGQRKSDDASESGYFAVRAALAQSVSRAAKHIAEKDLAGESTPILFRLITQIAERFSVRVSTKTAAQVVPALGAAGGAFVNWIFMKHFQKTARGHFIIRRLERKYGETAVRRVYNTI